MKTAPFLAPLAALAALAVSLPASFASDNAAAASTATPAEERLPGETALPAEQRPALQPYEKLIALLPPVPPEWKGEKPSGSLTDTEDLHLSTAARTYYKEEGKGDMPSAIVTIIDSSSNSEFFDSDGAEWENSTETEEGYDRRLIVDGMRAVEHYDKKAKTGSLSVFVAQRYFVQIELTNLDPKELTAWLKKVDIQALSELK